MGHKLVKFVLGVFIVVLVLVLGLYLSRNMLAQMFLTKAIRAGTGLEVSFDRIQSSLFKPSLEIQGMRLRNPGETENDALLEVRRLYLRYKVSELFREPPRMQEVLIDIPRVAVVYDENGVSNVERMLEAVQRRMDERRRRSGDGLPEYPPVESTGTVAGAEGGAPGMGPDGVPTPEDIDGLPMPKGPDIQIDKLTFRFGRIEYRNVPVSLDQARDMAIDINQDTTYENVTDLEEVGRRMAMEFGARMVSNLLGDEMQQGLGELLKGVSENKEDLKEKIEKAGRLFDTFFGK